MTALNKQALREVANAANIASWGKWESYKPHKGARGYEVRVGAKAVAQHCLKVDSAFIAAANPSTVLALLDELEAAEKRIAELEAEPVGTFRKGPCGYSPSFHEDAMPLYAAPPAPVVPEKMSYQDGVVFVLNNGMSSIERGTVARRAWNACRAAMLQGAEHVSNRDELPLGYLQGHKDGLEWAAQLAEANHPQTGDWLYDDPTELAKAIRKGPDMPFSDGNSPVIQDGWVLVPKELTCEMDDAAWDAYHETRSMSDIWAALLSAAPQQEVK